MLFGKLAYHQRLPFVEKMWYVTIAKQLDELGPQKREELLRQILDDLARKTEHEKAFVEVLLQENVFDKKQMEIIMARESKYERNVAAYNKVIENGNGRVLIWALHLSRNHHVISEIQEKLKKFQPISAQSSPPSAQSFQGLHSILSMTPVPSPASPVLSQGNFSPVHSPVYTNSQPSPGSPAGVPNHINHVTPHSLGQVPLALSLAAPQSLNNSIQPPQFNPNLPVAQQMQLPMTSQGNQFQLNSFSVPSTPLTLGVTNSMDYSTFQEADSMDWTGHSITGEGNPSNVNTSQGSVPNSNPDTFPLSPPMEQDFTVRKCIGCGRDYDICQILMDCPNSKVY